MISQETKSDLETNNQKMLTTQVQIFGFFWFFTPHHFVVV